MIGGASESFLGQKKYKYVHEYTTQEVREMDERLSRNLNVQRVRQHLRERYQRAARFAVAYGSGWEEAEEAYWRLQEFERKLSQPTEAPGLQRPAA